jgi:transposase
MPAQRKYPDELRERAVKMVLEIRAREGKGHGELARVGRQLGVHPEALRGWVKQADARFGAADGRVDAAKEALDAAWAELDAARREQYAARQAHERASAMVGRLQRSVAELTGRLSRMP